jgi:hypothetical protein
VTGAIDGRKKKRANYSPTICNVERAESGILKLSCFKKEGRVVVDYLFLRLLTELAELVIEY